MLSKQDKQYLDERFYGKAEIDNKFNDVHSKFDELKSEFTQLDEGVKYEFERVNEKLAQHDKILERLLLNTEQTNRTLDKFVERMDRHGQQLESHGLRLTHLETAVF